MPIARFQMPDGRIGRFEVPEGTTPEDAQRLIGESISANIKQDAQKPKEIPKANTELTFGEKLLQNSGDIPQPIVDFAAGASGLMRGGAKMLGLGDGIWPTSAASPESTSRTVGSFADPVSLAIGGGVMKAIPYAPVLGKGVIEGVKAIGKNMLGGSIAGAGIGTLSEDGTVLGGAGAGAALGVALPAAIGGATWLGKYPYHLVERFLPGGANAIAGRALNKAAGELQPQVVSELNGAEKGLTAGQAAVRANSAEFSALQEKMKELNPSEYDAIKQAQETDRLSSMRSIGKDSPNPDAPKPNISLAEQAREKVANRLYGDAFAADDMRMSSLLAKAIKAKGGIAQGTESPIPLDARLVPLTQNKVILDVANEVSKKNPELGNPIEHLRGLDRIKKMIDEDLFAMRNKLPTAIQNVTEASLNKAKSTLLNSMENLSPAYSKARLVYSEKSVPINQMQIGQTLEDALSGTIGVAERGTVFSNKVRDAAKIIANKTGQARYDKLSELFTPEQMGKVNRVIYELNRDARLGELSKAGMPAITKQLGDTSHEIKPLGILERSVVIGNAILRRIQGGAGEKSQEELSAIMQNPQLTAKLMENASASEKNALKVLQRVYKKTPLATAIGVNQMTQGQQ